MADPVESSKSSDADLLCRVIDDISELVLLASKRPGEALRKSDPWLQLPHPTGNGWLPASSVSTEAFDLLTRRALALRKLQGQVDHLAARKVLQAEFVRRFIQERREIDSKQAARLLSCAAKSIEKTRSTWTYFIPVRFMFTSEPEQIDLGPVVLLSLGEAGRSLVGSIREYLAAHSVGADRDWARKHLRKASEYYRSYKWVARVTISNCDEKVAERQAPEAVMSALDCLHFVLGRNASHRLRIGEEKMAHAELAMFSVAADGKLSVSTSVGSLDVMGFSDGWSKELERPDIREMLSLVRLALTVKGDLSLRRPLADRFLDAARWFGEAVREKSAFSKAVKFITAVERLVVAGKESDLTDTVSTRVADITLSDDSKASWEQRKKQVVKAYALRSDLVHGSVSPFAQRVLDEVSLCGDVAEHTLAQMLFRLGESGLLSTDVSEADYAAWFDRVRTFVSELHSRSAA